MRPVAQALAYAHGRGVVHRDLTPSNILIERGSGRVVTTDFGLARIARSTGSLTATGVLLGTPEYWSPELALGRENGAAADLYALGCILFLLLSGRLPFEGEDRLAVGLRRAHDDAPSLQSLLPDGARSRRRARRLPARARPGTTAGCHPRGRRAWCARRRLNCVFRRGGRCVGAGRADRRAVVRAADDPPFASVGDDRPGAAARGAAGVDATALVGAATRGHRSRRVGCGRRRRTRCRGRGAESAPACAKRRVAARRRGTRPDRGLDAGRNGVSTEDLQHARRRRPRHPSATAGAVTVSDRDAGAPCRQQRLPVRAGAGGRRPPGRGGESIARPPGIHEPVRVRTFLDGTQRIGGRAAATRRHPPAQARAGHARRRERVPALRRP